MDDVHAHMGLVEFNELESRYGQDSALAILKVLEQFEGVLETQVTKLSYDERMRNVLALMQDNMLYQTRH